MKKTYKIIVILIVILMIMLNINIIKGYFFLIDDTEVIETIRKQDFLRDYRYIELGMVTPRSNIEPTIHDDDDYFTNKPMEYTFFVRPFTVWLQPKDSIPANENWKVHGYITMDGRVFYFYRLRGDQDAL